MRRRRKTDGATPERSEPQQLGHASLDSAVAKLRDDFDALQTESRAQAATVTDLRLTVGQLQKELAAEREKTKKTRASQDATDFELHTALTALQTEVESGFTSAAAAVAGLQKRVSAAETAAASARASATSAALPLPAPHNGSTASCGTEDVASASCAPSISKLSLSTASAAGSTAPAGRASSTAISPRQYGGGGEPCSKCQKTVYAAERILAQGHVLHRACFMCAHCDAKLLNSPNWEVLKGDFLCQAHFQQRVRTDGGRMKNELHEKELPLAELQAMIDRKLREAETEYESGLARARQELG